MKDLILPEHCDNCSGSFSVKNISRHVKSCKNRRSRNIMAHERSERRGNWVGNPQQQIEIFLDMLRQYLKNKAARTRAVYIPLMRKFLDHVIKADPQFQVLTCYESKGQSVWRGIEHFTESLSNAPSKIQFLSVYIKVTTEKFGTVKQHSLCYSFAEL